MRPRPYNLAIETSGRQGSIALGKGDQLLASIPLAKHRRHNTALLPAVDQLCKAQGIGPADLGEIYVSVGPGSFTGLRVAITTVKMLALAQQMRVVAVPTLDVLAQNAPADVNHLAVCLNTKRGTSYTGVYERTDEGMVLTSPAQLRTMAELLALTPRPTALVGEVLEETPELTEKNVTVLPAEPYAVASAEATWRLGRKLAEQNEFTDPDTLAPLYVRRPEAVELWEQRFPTAART